ncbi:MAG TPA: ferrous iron transport protein B [archaeon]|nr:ferrous iron transport protein B [archaeon]
MTGKGSEKVKTVAVIGNPNVGKTVIFNSLTGMKQHVANWPGVTVEKKEGWLVGSEKRVRVVDLPGTYALTSQAVDEKISRDFLVNEKPDLVVNIVDASNLARNLNLTLQLIELEVPLLLVLNKMDMACTKCMVVNGRKLQEIMGVAVVETVAYRGHGMEIVRNEVKKLAESPAKPPKISYGDLERQIEAIRMSLGRGSRRWEAIHVLENGCLPDGKPVGKKTEKILKTWAKMPNGGQTEIKVIEARYQQIARFMGQIFSKNMEVVTPTDRLDRLTLNQWLAFPIFLMLMWVMFHFAYTLSFPFSSGIETGFEWLGGWVSGHVGLAWLKSLIVDGLIGGLGFLFTFVPPIAFLFFAIAWLEDSGYLPRAAFFMDRFMSKVGLHGRAFIPMLMGMGCNVPAIMATRSIDSEKDRLITILVNPLVSCSARLPVYVLLAGTFFPEHAGTVIFGLYALGVVLALAMAWLFRKTIFKGQPEPFILELPDYQWPRMKDVLLKTWQNVAEFLKKATTFLLAGVVIIWFLNTHPWGAGLEASYSAGLGHLLEPVFRPLGFGWEENVALIAGFMAKELVVGTFGTLYGTNGGLAGSMDKVTALAFMVFVLLYTPCLAVVGVIRKETGSWKWTAFSVGYSLLLAYGVGFIVKNLAGFLI